jgi:hypothetical protein
VPVDAAVQEQPEPVVVEVSESVSNAFDLLDEQVDGFGGPLDAPPVVCQARISVSHRLIVRASRAVSGNPAAVRPGGELGQRDLGIVGWRCGVDVAEEFFDGPGVVDLVAWVAGGSGGLEPAPLAVGEPFGGLEQCPATP